MRPKTKKNSELVVWGELWDGDSPQLVFALERDASRTVNIRDALWSSETFGELKRKLDPEDYKHLVGDPPTDLALHKNSPGYRLILNNVLFPAAKKKKQKT